MSLTVIQLVPALEVGGVERGTLEMAAALAGAGHRALVVSAGGRLVPELESVGGRHITLPMDRKQPLAALLIRRLRNLFAREAVDLVHARSRLPAWLGWLALRGMPAERRPRWVTTVHGPYPVNRYSRIMVSGERVIAISRFIRDYMAASYPRVDPQCVRLIPQGVDRSRWPRHFSPAAAWLAAWHSTHPELADRHALVLPGRLTPWKGQVDFLRVVARLVARGLPVHGLLAGGPHPRKRAFERSLRRLARDLQIESAISFLGQRSDLREVMAVSACAFSLTSEPEAFGRTTVEALSLGVPVVGYDHGGTGEILGAVFPAGLVPPGNVEEAAARCAAFLSTRPIVPATHPFVAEHMQTATLAVYAELCASPR